MNSKERFEKTAGRELADRLPVDFIWPRTETVEALKLHFGTDSQEDVWRELGIDFRWLELPVRYPDFEKKVNGVLDGCSPGAGRAYFFHDRRTFENAWGVVQRIGEDGKYLEWRGGALAGRESLEGWEPPAAILPSPEEAVAVIAPFREFVTVVEVEFPFKLAWQLYGMEAFLMSMIQNPDFVSVLYDRLYAVQAEKAELAARAGFDVVAVVGDVATQAEMMFSPRLFARYDVPRLTGLVAKVKAANPATRVLYHSDGNVASIIPLLIRCGVEILNPIQSACLDPARIKREFGDRLTLHGTISVQDTIPFGTAEEVRQEVRTRIRTVGYNGGLVLSPENSIPYDAPLENVLALYEAARNFDYDELRRERT